MLVRAVVRVMAKFRLGCRVRLFISNIIVFIKITRYNINHELNFKGFFLFLPYASVIN